MKRTMIAPARPCGAAEQPQRIFAMTFRTAISRKSILLMLCLTMLAALVSCGGSSKSTTATLPSGNYVFSLSGKDAVSPYFVSGVFTVANGAITGGEQDFIDFVNYGTDDQIDPTGSTISKTADGNLQITLVTCTGMACGDPDLNVGVAGVETLDGIFLPLNSKKAYITEFDASATATGTLEVQDPTAAAATPTAGYAFSLSGLDASESGSAMTIGGIINIDNSGAAGKISGAGSVFDADDYGTPAPAETFDSGTVAAPDPFGRVVFTVYPTNYNPDGAPFAPGALFLALAGYIVDANHIRLVETRDNYHFTLGGTALKQADTGQFNSASISANSYVVGLTGTGLLGDDAPAALQVAGLLTANSDGTVGGTINYNSINNVLTGIPNQLPISVSAGNYVVDNTGRVTLSGVTAGPQTFTLQLYLDGNGHALAATMDGHDVMGGVGYQQSGVFSASSFNGVYAIDATGWDHNNSGEFDAVGPITAMGSAGTFSGTADLNWRSSSTPATFLALNVSGTFTPAASGVFTGSITGLDVTTPANSGQFTFYLIDSTGDSIAIETDSNQLTLAFLSQQ
jgi:hypothetical protein